MTMIEQEVTKLLEENNKLHKEMSKLRDRIKVLEEQNMKLSKLLKSEGG